MTPFQFVDALLIVPFRLAARPEAGFILGVLVLALFSALFGRACAALVGRIGRARLKREEDEARHRQDLALEALRAEDREAYRTQNDLAQEAYGNTLAFSAGRGAALLWPGMAVLAWLCWRFEGAPMPFLWEGAGPAVWFLPPYIAALWGLGKLFPAPIPPPAEGADDKKRETANADSEDDGAANLRR